MIDKIKIFLELIRLPGMFTAHADILAAFLMIGARFEKTGAFLWLLLSSSCLFSAGMALNDYFDWAIDERQRPTRPIPSGRVSRTCAMGIGLCLLGAGIFFAFFAGLKPFYISLALASAILIYDGLLKHYFFWGPLSMASCRYFNLLMGLSVMPFKGWIYIPFITAVYIFGISVLSQKEAQGGKVVLNIGICAMAMGLVPFLYYFLYLKHVFSNVFGVVLAFCFGIFLAIKVLGLLDKNLPADFQRTMKILLLAIIALNMILASGIMPVFWTIIILVLYLPALFSVRLFKVT
jgi:4-hydroxybenzoate polyprenyltransferase